MSLGLETRLRRGSELLGLRLSDAQHQHLLTYIDLLQKWNRVYNLTAVKDPEQMLTQHVLDCLAVVNPLKEKAPRAKSLLDVGAGGGLPSVVLAITCPNLTVLAVDAVAKKTAFIQSTAHTLGLANLQAQHARVESLTQTFDVVGSRAYASLTDFVITSRVCLAPDGWWMAMKGLVPAEEIAQLPSDIEVDQTQLLSVPDLDAQRCLVWMRPKQAI
ncbi:MAG: 16S rRNA (guanine(527)-N(7))-methyltransferase RsmG [Betaproteobacteria bacterium]|nr:16S rRNA (guanine(527)-N(7))-methyltransferase RsmG [Betaproteobacteria bacterium]